MNVCWIQRLVLSVTFAVPSYTCAYAKERVGVGRLCVLGADTNRLAELLTVAGREGALVKIAPNNSACENYSMVPPYWVVRSVEVPSGLESWTLNLLLTLGYKVGYEYGTAGGSGPIEDAPRDSGWYFSEPINIENFDRISRDTFCKVKFRLATYFPEVEETRCGDIGFKNGFCRLFWLGGHVSNTVGFKGLVKSIGRKYWVSAKLAIDFGNFSNVPDSNSVQHGSWVLLRVTGLHSAYALMPPDRKPEPRQYHSIENDIPGVSGELGDALDFEIASKVSDVISSAPPLSQAPPCHETE
jgi:hypothetical protein